MLGSALTVSLSCLMCKREKKFIYVLDKFVIKIFFD